tara:strand:- start:35 stop:346 length:312 start_codon:yes stop_codon:yes gene_type:complete
MKPLEFPGNEQDCSFTYHRTREGPNFFVSHYKGTSRGHTEPKECWRSLAVAKFTDSGKALKEWCLEMDELYVQSKLQPRKDTSFASEAIEEESSPTDDTKMVT